MKSNYFAETKEKCLLNWNNFHRLETLWESLWIGNFSSYNFTGTINLWQRPLFSLELLKIAKNDEILTTHLKFYDMNETHYVVNKKPLI